MAVGVLMAACDLGLTVPGDVSITGFDDAEVSRIVWPRLTMVRQPVFDMAASSADMLLTQLTGDEPIHDRMHSHKLLNRESARSAAAMIARRERLSFAVGDLGFNFAWQSIELDLLYVYRGGAMIGRFVGSYVLRLMGPGRILAAVAVGAIALILISASSTGSPSGYSLPAIGLMNPIMFPTIFGLPCEKLGARAAEGSGMINITIVGGAVVPLLTGFTSRAAWRWPGRIEQPATPSSPRSGFTQDSPPHSDCLRANGRRPHARERAFPPPKRVAAGWRANHPAFLRASATPTDAGGQENGAVAGTAKLVKNG